MKSKNIHNSMHRHRHRHTLAWIGYGMMHKEPTKVEESKIEKENKRVKEKRKNIAITTNIFRA